MLCQKRAKYTIVTPWLPSLHQNHLRLLDSARLLWWGRWPSCVHGALGGSPPWYSTSQQPSTPDNVAMSTWECVGRVTSVTKVQAEHVCRQQSTNQASDWGEGGENPALEVSAGASWRPPRTDRHKVARCAPSKISIYYNCLLMHHLHTCFQQGKT